ncbi:hypothetical protein SODALDRAFT_321494 [Sodiomyces alkalinus F11]|uniref:Amino acid transporter n=1 Tax=Sodiomyces alkalinus (strain CBS 110278 / VKM F-3762 / F11) TaxID=1314773 RepID=A0A3N2PIV9_SODAK|nr:hypothetical protein SODALDRAFT_321494 [Sodiomyces alkalinus F11]ROT34487.1 hypothetical protein SODALDRAFT_321494 [Sodiomyces alkalinus F11]
MTAHNDPEIQPLLPPSVPSSPGNDSPPTRAIEDDVLPETSPLGRTLTWQSAYILVISRVIGSGVFATPGAILRSVGSPGLALLLWVVGGAAAACGLAVSLEFGAMLPRSGGDKVYLEFAYRRPRFLASTLVAANAVLLGFTASNCIVFSQYALFALGVGEPSDLNWLGWIKVGLIGFMLYPSAGFPTTVVGDVGAVLGIRRTGLASLSWDGLWEGSNWNWGILATSLFKVFYSFAGLDNANNVLDEVKDPVRTLKSVTFSALATSCGLYLLVNIAYFIVVPVGEIKNSGELIAALFFAKIFGAGLGSVLLPLAVALSAVGNVLVVAFAMARLKQEIARQGFLPFSKLLSSNRPFGSPLGGLLVHYIPSFLVIALPPSKEVYSFILEVEGYPGQFFSLAVAVGLVWLRFRRPDLRRPFKVWLPAVGLRMILNVA